jgi:hypothetical protein
MSDFIFSVAEQIPYTFPWWERFLRAASRWPERYARRMNTIVDMFEWYCQDHALIYLQTLLPAAGEAFLALISFDWDDVARGFLRPYGPGGRKSLVFDPRKAKWQWEIPELGEEIGKRIPGARIIKASRVMNATRFIWVIDGLIQRALYYFLVIDVLTEFLYNWSSAVLRALSQCGAAYYCRGGAYGDHGNVGWHSLPLGGFQSECISTPDENAGFSIGVGEIIAERPVTILADYTLLPAFPVECRARWRLAVRSSSGEIVDVSPWAYSWRQDSKDALLVARTWKPGRYRVEAYIDWSTCYTILWGLNAVAIK